VSIQPVSQKIADLRGNIYLSAKFSIGYHSISFKMAFFNTIFEYHKTTESALMYIYKKKEHLAINTCQTAIH
jgi:hypothetical protein